MSVDVLEKSPGAPTGAPPERAEPWVRLQCDADDGPITCAAAAHVVLIGSRRDCHLPVTHPNVSKVHCALVNTGRAVLARDLVSRSGTFLNNQAVRATLLENGGLLRVGPVGVGIEFLAPAATDQAGSAAPPTVAIRGQLFQLADTVLVVGRRNTADVVVDTPDTSLAHALIFALDGRPAIYDLGSRSGTWLNGERVELAWLPNGGEVEIGGERFCVCWEEAAGEEAAVEEPAAEATALAQAADQLMSSAKAAVPAGADIASSDELEQIIASVHSRLAAARDRLEERSREVDARAARLEEEQAAAEQRRAALAEAETELADRRTQLNRAEQELAQRCGQLDEQLRRLSEEQDSLKKNRVEIESAAAQVEEGRRALESDRATVAQQQAELSEAQAALQREQEALNEARQSCRKEEEQLRAQVNEIAAQTAELEKQRASVQASQSELATAQTAQAESAARLQELEARVAEREAALKSGLGELLNREAALTKREQDVQARESAIAAHDARNADIDNRIRDFKAALMRAGDLFSTATQCAPGEVIPSSAAKTAPATAAKTTVKADAGKTAPAHPVSKGTPPVEPAAPKLADSEELPAPMVVQPMFAAGDLPPPDWPPKLRERFRVLRRMSRKTDAELAQQVWAERERVLTAPEPPRENGRRKRRFWSN